MYNEPPKFITESLSAYCTLMFLETPTSMAYCCEILGAHIRKYYETFDQTTLYELSNFYLRILSDAKVEDASLILKSFIYHKLIYTNSGKLRKWSSLLNNALKAEKVKYKPKALMNKKFIAFVFDSKRGMIKEPPQNWRISSIDTAELFVNLDTLSFNPLDNLSMQTD